MAIKSHKLEQNRAFDYVYDPSYIVPGLKDIYREHFQKMERYAPIQVLTNYNVMFADVPKVCRQIIRQKYDLLPNVKFKSEAKYNPFNNDYIYIDNKCDEKYVKLIPNKKRSVDIRGANRSKFFYHPSNMLKSSKTELHTQSYQSIRTTTPQSKYKNIGIQTIYRESSAQTSPYLPNAIIEVNNDKTSEIVHIANVLQGTKQPGDFEVKVIERIRKQRIWEKSLSKVLDQNEIDKKQIIFEAFEWEKWLAREEQIKNIQNIRFEIVKGMMEKREKSMKENSTAKLTDSMQRIEEERKRCSIKLDQEYKRNLKKLEANHKKSKEKTEKDNMCSEQNKFDSKNLKLKSKIRPRYKIEKNVIPDEKFSDEYLRELSKKTIDEKFIEPSMTRIEQLAKPKKTPNEIYKGFNSEKNLKQLYESLKLLGENGKQETRKLKQKLLSESMKMNQNENRKNSIRPEKIILGTYCQFDNSVDEIYQDIVVTEKITNSILDSDRSIPSLSSTEIKKDYSIGVELKEVNSSVRSKEIGKGDDHSGTVEESEHSDETKNIETKNDLPPNSIFNFLDCELKKLQDERKVQALYILAERERIKREVAESGLRQKEDKRRREHDEIYRNLMKSSNDTVTMFLENVLIEETDLKACNDAREIIQKFAKDIDKKAHQEAKLKNTELFSSIEHTNSIVSDIIDNFLFPEIEKRLSRKSMNEKQQRHCHAANTVVCEQIQNVLSRKDSDLFIDKLIRNEFSSEELISGISANKNIAYHEASIVIRDIIQNVLTQSNWKPSVGTITKTLHTVTGTWYEEDLKKQNELFDNIISEIITKILEYVQDKNETETLEIQEDEKCKTGMSIVTIPGLTNLLELKRMVLAKKIMKLLNSLEQDTSDEDIMEKTTEINTYSFNDLKDDMNVDLSCKSSEEEEGHSENTK